MLNTCSQFLSILLGDILPAWLSVPAVEFLAAAVIIGIVVSYILRVVKF